jgi:hypothetical protein
MTSTFKFQTDMEDGRPRPSGNDLGMTDGTPVLHVISDLVTE